MLFSSLIGGEGEGREVHDFYTFFHLLPFRTSVLLTHCVAMGKSLPFLGVSFSIYEVGIQWPRRTLPRLILKDCLFPSALLFAGTFSICGRGGKTFKQVLRSRDGGDIPGLFLLPALVNLRIRTGERRKVPTAQVMELILCTSEVIEKIYGSLHPVLGIELLRPL